MELISRYHMQRLNNNIDMPLIMEMREGSEGIVYGDIIPLLQLAPDMLRGESHSDLCTGKLLPVDPLCVLICRLSLRIAGAECHQQYRRILLAGRSIAPWEGDRNSMASNAASPGIDLLIEPPNQINFT